MEEKATKQDLLDMERRLTGEQMQESLGRMEAHFAATLAGFEARMVAYFQERIKALEDIPDAKMPGQHG